MREDTIYGSEIRDDSIRHWKPVLQSWARVVDHYCESVESTITDNVPWMFMEVPNTGLLSIAAWQCGWVTLIESPGRKNGKHGYTDLWVKPVDRPAEYLEAKYSPVEHLSTYIEKACYEASTNKRYEENSHCLGVCYTHIVNYQPGLTDDNINCFIDALYTANPGAIAWCFPATTRNFKIKDKYASGMGIIAKRANVFP